MTPENFKLLLEDLERRVAAVEGQIGFAPVGAVGPVGPVFQPGDFVDPHLIELPNVGTADRQVLAIHKRGDYLGDILPNARVTLDGDYSVEDLLAIATLMARASGKTGVFRNED
jgi:hypothetical protein